MGLQSLPLQELELLQLVTEAVPKGSLLLGGAGVRLVRSERRYFIILFLVMFSENKESLCFFFFNTVIKMI